MASTIWEGPCPSCRAVDVRLYFEAEVAPGAVSAVFDVECSACRTVLDDCEEAATACLVELEWEQESEL